MQTLEKQRASRKTCHAFVAVEKCAPGRGVAGLRLIDERGTAAEHFVPFFVDELPSQRGRDYVYAGLIAALDRLRTLDVHRVMVMIDDASIVEEIEKRA